MQHPTIAVENGGLKINDERVFSLWIRLNEMAADDPVAAWAVAEIRALGEAQARAIGAAQDARSRVEQMVECSLTPHYALAKDLANLVTKHSELLSVEVYTQPEFPDSGF